MADQNNKNVDALAQEITLKSRGQGKLRQFILWMGALIIGAILGWQHIPALNELFDNIYRGYTNKPRYNSELMEMGLYSDAMTPILDNIAKAKALTSGIMQSASVKDADGKTLSQ